jgi:prolyl-tRNA editing enzyme YbaK/EbsC (Cys-tRNA(Pro) deacylase)
MHRTAEKFSDRVRKGYGLELEIQEFPEGTKTAEDAANAIGCELDQIAKSIVMKAGEDIVVVLTSGGNRVESSKLADYLGTDENEVSPGDPGEVKQKTGWSIGGVPPFGHENRVKVLMDEKLADFETVWAAAGTPEAVFEMEPEKLKDLSGAEVADVFE